MHPLMSRSGLDEWFWYNCKQGLDCSQGDIQVISRKVEGKLLEIWLMFLGTSGVRRKVENGLHLIQVWCTPGSLVVVHEAEVSSGTVIDKLDSGIEGWDLHCFNTL